jgi:hypothetical protein
MAMVTDSNGHERHQSRSETSAARRCERGRHTTEQYHHHQTQKQHHIRSPLRMTIHTTENDTDSKSTEKNPKLEWIGKCRIVVDITNISSDDDDDDYYYYHYKSEIQLITMTIASQP